jgi:DNA ligase-1
MFKPLLAATIKDVQTLRFPLLASQKFDGIRATVQGGRLLSRTLKEIPNRAVQSMFAGLPDGIDGELIYGEPCEPSCYRDTVSIVMSDDKPADGIRYFMFDWFGDEPFVKRLEKVWSIDHPNTERVEHVTLHNVTELEALERQLLERGAEGVMLRDPNGRYKEGRSTLNDRILAKLKRFEDCEAKVVSCFELLHNDNEVFRNELGRTARSSCQENKFGMDALGGLVVVGQGGTYAGVEFRVGTGFDAEERQRMWAQRGELVGRVAKVKYFPSGGKDKPRHPVFLGWRDGRDL